MLCESKGMEELMNWKEKEREGGEEKVHTVIINHKRLSNKSVLSLLQPSTPFPNAASRASLTVRTKTNSISFRISSATSCSTSLRFAHGKITLVTCAR